MMSYPPTNPQMVEDMPNLVNDVVNDVTTKVPIMFIMEGLSNRMEMPEGQGRTVRIVRLDHLEARGGGFNTDWTLAPQRQQGESDVITLQMVGIYFSQEANLNFYTSAAHARQLGRLSTQMASALERVVDQALIQAANASPRVNVSGGSTSDVIKAANLYDSAALIDVSDDQGDTQQACAISPRAHDRDLVKELSSVGYNTTSSGVVGEPIEGVSRDAIRTGKVSNIWGIQLYTNNNIRRETGDHGKTIIMKKGSIELLHRGGIMSKWLTDDRIGEGQKGHLITRTYGVRCYPWSLRQWIAIEDRKMDISSY